MPFKKWFVRKWMEEEVDGGNSVDV